MDLDINLKLKNKAIPLIIICLALGAWMREAAMGGGFGASVLCTVLLIYALVLWYFDFDASKLNPKAALLTIPVLVLAVGFLIQEDFVAQIFALPTIFLLLLVQVLFLFDKKAKNFIALRYVPMMFRKLFVSPINGVTVLAEQMKAGGKKKFSTELRNVLIGLAIAMPIVAVLVFLFASADNFYKEIINSIFNGLDVHINRIFNDAFFAGLLGLPMAICLAGMKHKPELLPETLENPPHLNITILATVLTSLLLVAVSFIALQFQHLFFAVPTSLPKLSQRAVEGFEQIVFASVVLFGAIIPVFVLAKKVAGKLPLLLKILVLALSVGNLIILYSALFRMNAYIASGGLSVKRLLSMWFMVLIALALIGLVVKCFVPRMGLMQYLAGVAVVGVCVLNLINIDRTVVQYDINKYLTSGGAYHLDLDYFRYMSPTILPDLKELRPKLLESSSKKDLDKLINYLEETKYWNLMSRNIFNFTLN